MHRRALPALLLAVVVSATVAAAAPVPEATSCAWPEANGDPLGDRSGLLARYEQLPRPCLQELFAACNAASGRTLLDFGTASTCSLGYEALLQQGFHGNFKELLAWWRQQEQHGG